MPVPKRWFPCSRDINEDAEVRELCNRFGLSGLRLLLEVLAIIDKTENAWRLSGDYIGSLSVKVGCKPRTTQQALQFMEGKNWLRCDVLPGNNRVYSAPNYLKYHKRREPKTDEYGSPPIRSYPSRSDPYQENKENPDPSASPNNGEGVARRASRPFLTEGKESAKEYVKRLGDRMTMPAANRSE